MAFTGLMSLPLGSDEVARKVADYVVQASDATSSAVYLIDPGEAAYHLKAQVGSPRFTSTIDGARPLLSWLRLPASPVALADDVLPTLSVPALPTALAVSIKWRGVPLGFIVLGPPRSRSEHGFEQLALLETMAQQCAAPIMAARLSESSPPRRIEHLDRATTTAIHDIKNSVSALSLLARNATRYFSDPEFQRDAIATLTRTVARMQRLLASMSSSTCDSVKLEPIDLRSLIVEATMSLAANPRVRFVRRLEPVHLALADRDALLRVVENLVTNAAEAIGEQGTVTVTLTEEHGRAVISVADTGCGMSNDYRERHLFSLFHSTKQDGWGVGLYHTKQIIERQAGTIHVDSVEGRGTTFTVTLPLGAPVEDASLEGVR
jgi:putative PEP-CTERM system histidine kinase